MYWSRRELSIAISMLTLVATLALPLEISSAEKDTDKQPAQANTSTSETLAKIDKEIERLEGKYSQSLSVYKELLQEARNNTQATTDQYKRTIEAYDNRIGFLFNCITVGGLAITGVFGYLAIMGFQNKKQLEIIRKAAENELDNINLVAEKTKNCAEESAKYLKEIENIYERIAKCVTEAEKAKQEAITMYEAAENLQQQMRDILRLIETKLNTEENAENIQEALSMAREFLSEAQVDETQKRVEEGADIEKEILAISFPANGGQENEI